MISIGFTGSRDGMTDKQKSTVSDLIRIISNINEIHHGDCIGCDEDFFEIVTNLHDDIETHSHPCTIDSMRAHTKSDIEYEPGHPLDRNKNIVDLSDYIIGCPGTEEEVVRSGTWATIRYAKKENKSVIVIWPNGYLEHYN